MLAHMFGVVVIGPVMLLLYLKLWRDCDQEPLTRKDAARWLLIYFTIVLVIVFGFAVYC